MKSIKILFILLYVSFFGTVSAQLNGNCPGCTANTSQFGSNITDYSVGLFPDSVVFTQNSNANIVVTYLLPKLAATGVSIAPTATVSEVDILGVNGAYPIPTGISATCDNYSTNCKYYPQTNRYGCVKLCGITTDAATNGWMLAKITVAGTGSAAGQTQTQNQDINFYYKVLPDTTACHTVCFQNKVNTGCDSATLGVKQGIDIGCSHPGVSPCSFYWSYGNGQVDSGLGLHTVKYTTPGSYPVSLTKINKQYYLSSISGAANGSWFHSFANLYGVNSSAVHITPTITTGTTSNNPGQSSGTSITFNNLTYALTDSVIAIHWIDNDAFSNIDGGTFSTIITGAGTYTYSTPGNDVNGTFTISLANVDTLTYTDTAYIYASPVRPVIVSSKDSICLNDSTRLSIGTQYAGNTINWYQDTTFLIGQTDSFIYVKNAANYTVSITNPTTHCKTTSEPHPIAVSTQPPFGATLYYQNSQQQFFINPYAAGSYAEWYFDSTLVSGQNGQFLPSLGNGHYYVKVYPTGYPQCSLTSAVYTLDLNTGINGEALDVTDLKVYPNPNTGTFFVRVNVLTPGAVRMRMTDMLGRVVYEKSLINQSGEIIGNINLSELAKNIYTLEVITDHGRAASRVVVE